MNRFTHKQVGTGPTLTVGRKSTTTTYGVWSGASNHYGYAWYRERGWHRLWRRFVTHFADQGPQA